jgi:hypothetical protein
MDDIFLVWNTQERAHTHARTQIRMLARKYARARVSYSEFQAEK